MSSKKKTEVNHQDSGGKKSTRGGDTRFGGSRGNPISKEHQFGQPNGNPQGNGFFQKEDTPRYKIEKMFTLDEDELREVLKNRKSAYAERKLATFILQGGWKEYRDMIHEVYGNPENRTELKMSGSVEGINITFKDCSKDEEKA